MRGHCQRCDREVSASYKQPDLRRWVKVYFMLGAPFIPLLPIIGSDFAVMLPLTMVYLIGLGPALAIIRSPPFCDDCGAFIDTTRSKAQA